MIVAIPLDFILWNIFMGSEYGFRNFKQICKENYKQWKDI